MKALNVENAALNGRSFNEEVHELVGSIADSIKGTLSITTIVNSENYEIKALGNQRFFAFLLNF